MRFPPELLDEIRARLPVSDVVARKVNLKRAGREMRGLSPFKTEKSPSFFVNDQKGFYHCFASGEHGDIFTFLMKVEGLSFPEAVERLAEEAGVTMPKPTPQAEQQTDRRSRIYDLVEAACRFFQAALAGRPGQEARRYLERRGVARDSIDAFRLGYAPESRNALKDHLAAQGFTVDEMITAGMEIGGADIKVPYDRFRNRVMFPIMDLKGRVIAFGGRTLDPNQPAKYMNSPETPLFHKGANLYNAHAARRPAHDRSRIVVVEGYMDVVALAQAGFTEAVAPLGTALTEDQVRLLWRMAAEPILCFDGDTAGRRAANRAVDTVLPHLRPGLSLRFSFLPGGLDPDDIIRTEGPDALAACLDAAQPLGKVLFERESAAGDWSTAERRADLRGRLLAAVARIGDEAIREGYRRDVLAALDNLWRGERSYGDASRSGHPAGRNQQGRGQNGERIAKRVWDSSRSRSIRTTARETTGKESQRLPMTRTALAGATSPLRTSRLVAGEQSAPPNREALLMRTLINHPWLLDDWAEQIAEITFESTALSRLRDAILSIQVTENSLDRTTLASQLTVSGLDKVVNLVERANTHRSDRFCEPDAERAEVEAGWRHALALHERQSGLKRSLSAALQAFDREGSEDALARICEIKHLLAQDFDQEALDSSP